jgi:hypothetical protein
MALFNCTTLSQMLLELPWYMLGLPSVHLLQWQCVEACKSSSGGL